MRFNRSKRPLADVERIVAWYAEPAAPDFVRFAVTSNLNASRHFGKNAGRARKPSKLIRRYRELTSLLPEK